MGKAIFVAIICGVLIAVAVLFTVPLMLGANPVDVLSGKDNDTSAGAQTVEKLVVTGDQDAVVAVAEQILPTVVYIEAQFRGSFRNAGATAIGSGFVYSSDGYIVTNNHMVEGASSVNVSLADGSTYQAKVVGNNPDMDLAVLKIDASGLPVAQLGSSSDLVVGELAVAIGSPEGFEQSVTSGIISALGRDISIPPNGPDLRDLIQTDAAINPGNSGGPLCNGTGEVVGINTAIVSESGGYDGIGFAIPIDDAISVIEGLIKR
jgi:S1-C subfamily serine protease